MLQVCALSMPQPLRGNHLHPLICQSWTLLHCWCLQRSLWVAFGQLQARAPSACHRVMHAILKHLKASSRTKSHTKAACTAAARRATHHKQKEPDTGEKDQPCHWMRMVQRPQLMQLARLCEGHVCEGQLCDLSARSFYGKDPGMLVCEKGTWLTSGH